MARSSNQKLKLLYLAKFLLENSDENHPVSTAQIISELSKKDISAERKSIYDDIEALRIFGLDIVQLKGKNGGYYIGEREFELPELKLLVDSVQSSKFITQDKTYKLIKKIEGLASAYDGQLLQRQVYINDRVKTMNESVYYNVDDIHTAIGHNKKIRFKYYKWDINKKLVPKRNGEWFVLSPWALVWDDEYYYMLAYDEWDEKIKHYRVDKMMHIGIEDEMRSGKEVFEKIDMAEYSKATFGMYNGVKTRVKIHFANHMCGVFLDRFGKDISFRTIDEGHSEVNVYVNVSPQFFGWIFSLGKDVKVIGPSEVVEQMKVAAKEFLENMGE